MTAQEARKKLAEYSSTNGSGLCTNEEHNEAKKIAIVALEKQIPKKPIGYLHSCPHYRCPTCHRSVVLY